MFTYLIKGESPQCSHIEQQVHSEAQIIILDDKKNVAGYIMPIYNFYHPYHTNLDIVCLLDNDTQMFYRETIQYLCTRFDKIKISCYSDDKIDLVEELLQQGFLKKRRCFEGSISMDNVTIGVLAGQPLVHFDYTTCPFFLKECIVGDYKIAHQSISPLNRDIEPEEFFHVMTENSYTPWSFYNISDEKMMYFIAEQIDSTTCFISYVGGNVALQTLKSFYQQCLCKLMEMGVKSLEYEIDDINALQMTLGELFPLTSHTFDAYIYEKEKKGLDKNLKNPQQV